MIFYGVFVFVVLIGTVSSVQDFVPVEDFLVTLHNISYIDVYDYVDAHLNYLTISYPEVTIVNVYKNLIPYDFLGYHALLSNRSLQSLHRDPRVKLVETMGIFSTASMISYIPFDEDKIGRLNLDSTLQCVYEYDIFDKYLFPESDPSFDDNLGRGVEIYVLDTGIQADHPALQSKVRFGFDAIRAGVSADQQMEQTSPPGVDPNGHGTYVAGIIGGRYGVARGAQLVDVKVLDEQGYGTAGEIIAGLDFIVGEALKHGQKSTRAIANLSLTGPKQEVLNAVIAAISSSVLVVGAVGDKDEFVCETSPASAKAAISVAAVSRRSLIPIMNSNFGECINVFAPGEFVPSLSHNLSNQMRNSEAFGSQMNSTSVRTETRSGSSAAAAFITGLAAVTLSMLLEYSVNLNDANPAGRPMGNGVTDHDLRSFVARSAAPLLRTIMRLPDDQDRKNPHTFPFTSLALCKASRLSSPLPLVRALVREEIMRKIATKSLSGIKKTVSDMSVKSDDPPKENNQKHRQKLERNSETTKDPIASTLAAEEGSDGSSRLVETLPNEAKPNTRKQKSQAEIIQEARKLKAQK